jgi:hypothetical protein
VSSKLFEGIKKIHGAERFTIIENFDGALRPSRKNVINEIEDIARNKVSLSREIGSLYQNGSVEEARKVKEWAIKKGVTFNMEGGAFDGTQWSMWLNLEIFPCMEITTTDRSEILFDKHLFKELILKSYADWTRVVSRNGLGKSNVTGELLATYLMEKRDGVARRRHGYTSNEALNASMEIRKTAAEIFQRELVTIPETRGFRKWFGNSGSALRARVDNDLIRIFGASGFESLMAAIGVSTKDWKSI